MLRGEIDKQVVGNRGPHVVISEVRAQNADLASQSRELAACVACHESPHNQPSYGAAAEGVGRIRPMKFQVEGALLWRQCQKEVGHKCVSAPEMSARPPTTGCRMGAHGVAAGTLRCLVPQ